LKLHEHAAQCSSVICTLKSDFIYFTKENARLQLMKADKFMSSSQNVRNVCIWNQATVQKIRILHGMGLLFYNQAGGPGLSKIKYSLLNFKGETNQPLSFALCFPEILNHPQNPCVDF
jgi:hypothetical protein